MTNEFDRCYIMLNDFLGPASRKTVTAEKISRQVPHRTGLAPANAPSREDVLPGRKGYVTVMGLSVLLLAALRRKRRRLVDEPSGGKGVIRVKAKSHETVEEALRKSRIERFIFSENATPMFVLDVETSVVMEINEAALRLFGFSRKDFLPCSVEEFFPGTSGSWLRDEGVHRCMLRKKNGAVLDVEVSGPLFVMNGRAARLLAVREVHTGEMRLNAFVALGHRLCAARTQREAIQIILETADQFFGWDACTFDSYSVEHDRVHPIVVIDRVEGERRDVEPVVKDREPTARMRKVIEEGARLILRQHPVQMPVDSVPMGDQSRPSASLMYVPVRSGERVIGLLSIQSYTVGAYTEADLHLLQALTDHGAGALERIQAEEKVRELNAVLEARIAERTAALRETVGELEAFSYSVSHDMRAPLRAMQGYAEKLLEEYSGKVLNDGAAEYLSRISRAAVRLDLLIQDVLTYARVLRAEIPIAPVNMERLIADLIEAYPEWQAPRANVCIQGPIPEIRGNEGLLTQCISNLISNAVKFVAPGVIPKVTIRAEQFGPRTRIWFEDNGVGIASENHDRIFRLFERIYPASEFDGTGVGLTIVRKAIERMNGQVGFESEYGKGSKFWIQL